jgi:DNA-binding protein HU-beta
MAKKEVVKADVAKKSATKEAAAPATRKAAAPLLTVSEISEHLASTFEIPRSHAKAYLAETIALMGKHLKKGNKVRISGLGIFQVKKRAARKGRNPNTGEAMKIKASKRVAFTVARDLKATL